MKRQILFFCMVLGMFFVSAAHNLAAYNEVSTDSNSRDIPLKGEYEDQSFRKGDFISVKKQSDFILTRFQRHVRVIQVTITNEWGEQVFDEIVNAAVQPFLAISLMELPEGNYEIRFSNERIELSGEFEI
ncbi:MAG: DUF3244 domain-containing protein [Dysgonamonadaceae bacterium]|jgi:hypothetical protein|nr:DUF3244 domain-containing protein [Dysgonamonadaceae bacterium]